MKKTSAFTLIELLVAISIISLLSSVVFASVQETQAKARDTNKKVAVSEVQKALQSYQLDKADIPGVVGTKYQEGTPAYDEVMGELVTYGYLVEVPKSPTGDSYSYVKSSPNSKGKSRGIFQAELENYENNSDNKCEVGSLYNIFYEAGNYLSFYEKQNGGFYTWYISNYNNENDFWTSASTMWCNVGEYVSSCPAASNFEIEKNNGVCEISIQNFQEVDQIVDCADYDDVFYFAYLSQEYEVCDDSNAYCACVI
jgi:type II secretion system protein G